MNRRLFLATGASAATLAACAPMPTGPDIVDVAMANDGNFSTLLAAVQQAGLVETLQGPGPFTLFAPTNSAFGRLPAGTVDDLLLPENRDRLVEVLTYHVVPGAITSDQLAGQRQNVATVQGGTVTVDGTHGVRVNGARVVAADLMASNGVIHAIDGVLLP